MDIFVSLLPWITVGFCILAEAFFAMSELSIVSANRIRLEEAVRKGSSSAQRVLWFRERPDRLFGTTLLGTNFSTVTGSTVASLTLIKIDPANGGWWAMLLMSPLVLIGAEIIPKSIGQSRADSLAGVLATPLYIVNRLFTPFIVLVRSYTRLLYRLLGLEEISDETMVSREELVLLMEVSDDPGEIEEDEREMISRIFAFNQLRARDSMVPLAEMVAISHTSTVRDAVELIARAGYSRLPVYDERIDNIVGILHHLDLFTATGDDINVAKLMRPAHFVPETQDVDEVMVVLQREAASAAIVVDEFGGTVGLLTLEDIIEEIVGEIHDEHDSRTGLWRQLQYGIAIDARATVELVNQELNAGIPESTEYETVAGFILETLRRIPRVGETVVLESGHTLTVRRASARAIQEVYLETNDDDQ
ncbi:MAG: hemolysin family protein [Myxococcota bacterium]|nr:hemolysin family protein [Myxococcota bacterium]